MKRNNILINSMEGIGDQIYQRPFIKWLVQHSNKEVYVSTFLPQLLYDIDGVKFVDPRRKNPDARTYRTQAKEQYKVVDYKKEPSIVGKYVDTHYGPDDITNNSIFHAFHTKLGVPFDAELQWDLPDFTTFVKKSDYIRNKKIAIIRPATIRNEWEVHTRNPLPEYINWCAKVLMESGYYVISVADIEKDKEWLVGNKPPAHLYLHEGELGIFGTLELIRKASIVVGGSGFIVPASISLNTKLFLIFGGRMMYDSPYKILHSSMTLKNVGWVVPDNPCRCTLNIHECDKRIKNLESEFFKFLKEIQ